MFKRTQKIILSSLTSSGKLQQKIWGVSIALLLPSLLLIDVINGRTASNYNWIILFIQNIHWIVPWGLVYLVASHHRDVIKIFTPLYLSLILLVTTGSLAFHLFKQSRSLEEKFEKEMANIMKDFTIFLDDMEAPLQNPPLTYTVDEYGLFAAYLNKFKKLMDLSKQESMAVIKALNEAELNKVFTDEVIFNFFNIVEKKRKLEKLSLFLEESSKRTEDIYSEYVTWVLFSPDLDEGLRKNFVKLIATSPEEKKFFRQEPYKIKKNIVQEYIKFLDFLSEAYGNYERGEAVHIVFVNDKDLQAWRSHGETIEKLFKEEENFALLSQQRVAQIEKSL